MTLLQSLSTACAALVLMPAAAPALAHVSLEQAVAAPGSGYKAVFRIGHGCEGTATHTVRVQLPEGFRGARPMPKAGWAIELRRAPLAQPYESHGKRIAEDVVEVTWRARSREAWLPDAHYDEFVLRGQAPEQAGPAWFKVQQLCERGRWDWSDIPASGTATRGLRAPAVLLMVQAADAAAPVVSAQGLTVADAWVRATVPQQQATGFFARITSAKGARLVSASSPLAGIAEIHEMTVDAGGVMRMRAVAGVDLPPGKAVDLQPGGYHVMLMNLKRAVNEGESVPMTLVVQNPDGKQETIAVNAPVRPLGGAVEQHKH
jgi:copper(I)-binding protein